MEMKAMLEMGYSKTAVAHRLKVNHRTVTRWLKEGTETKTRKPLRKKLDPYKVVIRARLETHPDLSAQRLHEEVKVDGYDGCYSQLVALVQTLRKPSEEPEPVIRFETAAGDPAQLDFGTFHTPWGKRHALVVVLVCSYLQWFEFCPNPTMEVVMRGLEKAFDYFGGVPTETLFDQMKSVVIGDHREKGGNLLLNETFQQFARHWNFNIRACRPYRAQIKPRSNEFESLKRGVNSVGC